MHMQMDVSHKVLHLAIKIRPNRPYSLSAVRLDFECLLQICTLHKRRAFDAAASLEKCILETILCIVWRGCNSLSLSLRRERCDATARHVVYICVCVCPVCVCVYDSFFAESGEVPRLEYIHAVVASSNE
jgi:hypothetical protein